MNCKISIIVPVYNVEQYVGKLIESLQNQSYSNIEIILVDDGSLDKSGEICDEYASNDKRIKVIHKKNNGVGAARNDGLAIATGKWVLFCDSDDWMELEALEKLIIKGEETESDVVFGDVNLVYDEQIKSVQFYKDEFVMETKTEINRLIEADFCKTYCYNPPRSGPAFGYGGPWNKIVKKDLIDEANIKFDLRVRGIFDDIIYTAYIFAAANKVAYIHVPVYNYRQLNTSITHKYKPDMLDINVEIFNSWKDFLKLYDKNSQFLRPYYANVVRRLTASLGQYFFNEKNKYSLKKKLEELDRLIRSEPYYSAVRKADYEKLNNRFDRMVAKAAKNKSPLSIYLIFQSSVIKNKVFGK